MIRMLQNNLGPRHDRIDRFDGLFHDQFDAHGGSQVIHGLALFDERLDQGIVADRSMMQRQAIGRS